MASVLTKVEIEKIDAPLGAYVHIAAEDVMNEGVGEQVMAALGKYGVLVFPQINLSDDQFVAFSKELGDIHALDADTQSTANEANGIYKVTKDKDDQTMLDYIRGNDYWHMDGTSYNVPGKSTLLKCEQPPASGGDTEFADLFSAWEAMPQAMKEKLEALNVVHCFRAVGPRFYETITDADLKRWDAVFPPTEHPLVWHQKDGRTSLLIGCTALGVPEMEEKAGADFLEELVDFCTTEQFVYRHKWRKGDMVMFNNPGLLHRSTPYDKASGRIMHRTTIKGTEPIVAEAA
jgi:alpha-ketoglutarate-dependent taurine dioxygenase